MAANFTAILKACEEAALGVIGTSEVVTAGTFLLGAYQPINAGAPATAFLSARAEVELGAVRDTGLVPRSSNIGVFEVDILVRCLFTTSFELDDDGRLQARKFAVKYTEQIRAALTHPGNLVTTSAASATELCSGCLIKASSKVTKEDFPGRLIVTEITAKGLVSTSRP